MLSTSDNNGVEAFVGVISRTIIGSHWSHHARTASSLAIRSSCRASSWNGFMSPIRCP